MTREEASKIYIPKWPQCVINGEKITVPQALEIIRRTDTFFSGLDGNNREFNKKARAICRMPEFEYFENYNIYDKAKEAFKEKWGVISTNYIDNNWISCGWIGGYHGWCHPDGTIAYCNNIGKWPEVEEVYNDLCTLGENFIFLNLTCTLMNGEENYCDRSLVTMQLKNGQVEFIDTIPFEQLKFNGIKLSVRMDNENYFGLDQIQKWADEVYNENNK